VKEKNGLPEAHVRQGAASQEIRRRTGFAGQHEVKKPGDADDGRMKEPSLPGGYLTCKSQCGNQVSGQRECVSTQKKPPAEEMCQPLGVAFRWRAGDIGEEQNPGKLRQKAVEHIIVKISLTKVW
jgi:hypothetical protein